MGLFNRKKKQQEKLTMPISTGVAKAVESFVDSNMGIFFSLSDYVKEYGYNIDTPSNRVEFAFGLLAPEILYAFQVYPQERANHICDLAEYLLSLYETEDKFLYGLEDAYLDIRYDDILEVYKNYEATYMKQEKEFLAENKDFMSLPINYITFIILAVILDYNFDLKGMDEIRKFFDFCIKPIYNTLTLWKILDANIDYIWSE